MPEHCPSLHRHSFMSHWPGCGPLWPLQLPEKLVKPARVYDHPDCPWATEDSSLGLATLVPRKGQGLLEEQATNGVSV